MTKRMKTLLMTMAVSLTLSACSPATAAEGTAAEKKKLVIGTSAVSVDLAESGVASLEEMGYEVELKVFDDYFLPNQALVEGSLDANFYQHEPFLNMYNEENSTDIKMVDPKLYNFYGGLYSVKADSIDELPEGGIAGIAVDASNMDQDLRRLQDLGLIKLSSEEKELYDIADIVENPKNFEFISADHSKYTNMDDYSFIIGSSNTMVAAGVDPTENLLEKFVDDSLAQGICMLPENIEKQWAKDIMTAYTSDAAREHVKPQTGFEPVE